MRHAVVATAAATALYGAQATSGIGRALQCRPGTRQLEPIVLGCAGGSTQTQITLAPAGSEGSAMSWQVAQGTRDLYVSVSVNPMAGLTGDADLAASCNKTQMVGKLGTILTPEIVKSHMVGADWAWSGDDARIPIHEWLSVTGSMACDLTLYIQNRASTALSGTVSYSWSGVFPCPSLVPGCAECSSGQCPVNSTVMCDGSAAWSCSTPVGSSASPLVGDFPGRSVIPNFPWWFYALFVCVMFLMLGAACLPAMVTSSKGRRKGGGHTRSLELHEDGVVSSNPYGEALSQDSVSNLKKHDMGFGYFPDSPRTKNPVIGPNPFLNNFAQHNQYQQMPGLMPVQPYTYAEVPSPYGPAGPPPY